MKADPHTFVMWLDSTVAVKFSSSIRWRIVVASNLLIDYPIIDLTHSSKLLLSHSQFFMFESYETLGNQFCSKRQQKEARLSESIDIFIDVFFFGWNKTILMFAFKMYVQEETFIEKRRLKKRKSEWIVLGIDIFLERRKKEMKEMRWQTNPIYNLTFLCFFSHSYSVILFNSYRYVHLFNSKCNSSQTTGWQIRQKERRNVRTGALQGERSWRMVPISCQWWWLVSRCHSMHDFGEFQIRLLINVWCISKWIQNQKIFLIVQFLWLSFECFVQLFNVFFFIKGSSSHSLPRRSLLRHRKTNLRLERRCQELQTQKQRTKSQATAGDRWTFVSRRLPGVWRWELRWTWSLL